MRNSINQAMFEPITSGMVSWIITGVGSVIVLLSLGSMIYGSVNSNPFPAGIGFLVAGSVFLFWGVSDLVAVEYRRTILSLRLVAFVCSGYLLVSFLQRILIEIG